MTASNVTNVEYSRLLKRQRCPQQTQMYWQGLIPSLTTIQGLAATSENKTAIQWKLVQGKPEEPYAAAYTLKELQKYLTDYLATHPTKKGLPFLRKEADIYICSIDKEDLFTASTESDAFAQAVLFLTRP